jgi:hypothetical protein
MAEEEPFQFDDEQLNEIDYFEIVSLEEIIKLNPTFVAFSNEEIYNYLFAFFKSKSKADSFLNLFSSIIEKQKTKINTNNFIIVSDAKRGFFSTEDDDDSDTKNAFIEDFISKIKSSNKEPIKEAYKNKNKIWFPLVYDNESSKIKFKASSTTIIDLTKENSGDRYIIFKDDERDIPILGVYFYEPVVLDDDYLNEKIVSFLIKDKSKNIHKLKSAEGFKSFDDLIKDYKMELPLDKIDTDEYHYGNINSLFKKYNKDLDTINNKDFDDLKIFLENLIKSENVIDINYSKINKISPANIKNNRFYFFKFLNNSKNLADITLKTTKKLKDLLDTYTKEKTDTDYFPIVKNLANLIDNIKDDNYDEIIKNIREVRKNLSIDNCIAFINKTSDIDINHITEHFNTIENKYNLLLNTYKDIFKISFSFEEDEAEIKKGNDINDYEGVPVYIDNYKKDAVYIDDDDEIYEENDDDEENEKIKYNEFNKYYHNLEKGYSDALKIVLPFIGKMRIISKLPINYEVITNHLFNIYRGIPEKEKIIRDHLKGDYDDSYYKEQTLKTIKFVLTTDNEDIKLKDANNEYMKTIINMIYDVICKWSILIQNDILTNNLLFIRENCYIPCIDLWNDYGYPYDSNSKNGVFYYILCIFNEEYSENDYNYFKLDKDYKNIIKNKLQNDYKDDLKVFNVLDIKKKKENIGLESGKKLIGLLTEIRKDKTDIKKDKTDKLLDTFIEALVFMPSHKYQKIHKYLLGCCLEQIDDSFTADTFINNERIDIKKAKSKFASERVLNKKRYKRFYITKEYIKKDNTKFKEISNYILYDDFYSVDLIKWFTDLEENNKSIINNSNLTNIKDNLRDVYLNHIDQYIPKLFGKTLYGLIKQKSNFYSFHNFRQILISISHILYTHLKDDSKIFIQNINETIKQLDKLSSIINDDNITDIIQIRTIFVIRAMCLPSYPNITSNNPKLTPSITISKELSNLITNDINKKIISIINYSNMPSQEDQLNYINKIREENKDKIIAALNKKSREEKDVIKEMKKYGLEVKDDDNDTKVNKDIIVKDDDEPEDNNEFNLGEEDAVDNEDNLDNEDYGFLYT